jgi:hypothetical protein
MSNETYIVQVPRSGIVAILWMATVLLLAAGVVAIFGGLANQSPWTFGMGFGAIFLALLLISLNTVIGKLASIDAHIQALVGRAGPRA